MILFAVLWKKFENVHLIIFAIYMKTVIMKYFIQCRYI